MAEDISEQHNIELNIKLIITEFGNPILRAKSSKIEPEAIGTTKIQQLILSMQELLLDKKLGIGLAAPQIGKGIALAVVAIRPNKRRPNVKPFDLVVINPRITQTFGYRKQLYEGCISGGPGKAGLFARVPRYKKIKLEYYDQTGTFQTKIFEGLNAQVLQHEVDHLNGILFVDNVTDTKSYKTLKEYKKYVAVQQQKTQRKTELA